MPKPLTDTLDALDAAIAASLQTRREKLACRVRNQTIRMLIAGITGLAARKRALDALQDADQPE
jgi:hypothetical protein